MITLISVHTLQCARSTRRTTSPSSGTCAKSSRIRPFAASSVTISSSAPPVNFPSTRLGRRSGSSTTATSIGRALSSMRSWLRRTYRSRRGAVRRAASGWRVSSRIAGAAARRVRNPFFDLRHCSPALCRARARRGRGARLWLVCRSNRSAARPGATRFGDDRRIGRSTQRWHNRP